MNKTIPKRIMALMLTLAMIMTMAVVPSFAADDVTDLLVITQQSVTQNDVAIEESTPLDFSKAIKIALEFQVPVIGDGGSGSYVEQGNTAQIVLAKGFKITSIPSTLSLIFNDVPVGSIQLETITIDGKPTAVANITFDDQGEGLFDGSEGLKNVKCKFSAVLEYDGKDQGTADQTDEVFILDKEYTVNIPAIETEISGEKTGVRDGQYIDWTFKVEAKKGDTNVSLEGYRFYDNLTNVGEYVTDSFKIGDSEDGTGATAPDPNAVYENKILTYDFPSQVEGSESAKYVFFRTEIPQSMLYSNKTESITNTAQVFKEDTEEFSDSDDVEFKFQWIEKDGASFDFDAVTNTGYLRWVITANQGEAFLQGAYITDVLDERLIWESATYNVWNGTAWVPHSTISFSAEPTGGKYVLGDISTKVQLVLVTKVNTPTVNIGHTVQSIGNTATLDWTNSGLEQGIDGTETVGIGLNPISKKAETYNVTTHQIPWTVTVKKSDVSASLYVLDLLVYGSGSFNWDSAVSMDLVEVEGTAGEGTLDSLTLAGVKALVNKPTPRYNQAYVANSFTTGHGLKRLVYTLKDSNGKAIADLVLVTKSDGNGIDFGITAVDQVFSFKTVVTNPAIYAKNGDTTIYNTATLYSGNVMLNKAEANTTYKSNMLLKDKLSRDDAANPDENKNSGAASTGIAYDYENHTVVYRLHVNANGLTDLTGDLTGTAGETVGKVTLKDTLPVGWEFIDIQTGKKFLIY